MRHRVGGKKLNRHYNERRRLYTQLMTAIIDHRRITTTQAKAQAIRPEIEKLITMARHAPTPAQIEAAAAEDRDARRQARAEVFRRALMELGGSKRAAHRLLEVAPDYADRPGGYVRLTKIGPRKGDAAEMVVLELV
ncbi:MAG TPA: 50S ribosomal protein L17 [Herpetosiphonaceae bacterium]|jgi:large subunit ribosomal protein L17|nr:50S ribosomal protein L17 [Herpetosiphonaceae bacterium]